MYFIPGNLLRTFQAVSGNNRSKINGRHVETLAYLFGYESEGNLIATHLVFPEQNGTCSKVDDNGKKLVLLLLISLTYTVFLKRSRSI